MGILADMGEKYQVGALYLKILYYSIQDLTSSVKDEREEAYRWLSGRYDKRLEKEGRVSYRLLVDTFKKLQIEYQNIFGISGSMEEIPEKIRFVSYRKKLLANSGLLATLLEYSTQNVMVEQPYGSQQVRWQRCQLIRSTKKIAAITRKSKSSVQCALL